MHFCPQVEKKLRISLITGFFLFGIFSGYASAEILPTTSGTGIDHCFPFPIETKSVLWMQWTYFILLFLLLLLLLDICRFWYTDTNYIVHFIEFLCFAELFSLCEATSFSGSRTIRSVC